MHLLIIDDEQSICEEFHETLEQQGHQVDFATNGKEGIYKIQTNTYDLVFLDASMPFMNGKKVLENIRHFSNVPVAFITGFLPESQEKEILNLGALICMQKPLELNRVESLIKTIETAMAEKPHPKKITGVLERASQKGSSSFK